MTITTPARSMRLALLTLSLAVPLGCGGTGGPFPDANTAGQVAPGHEEVVNYKDALARCRFKLDHIRSEVQRLEKQRLDLLDKLTNGGTLSVEEAKQEPKWRLFARQLKIVAVKQRDLNEMADSLEAVIPKLEIALINRQEANRRQFVLTDDDLNILSQVGRALDEDHKRDADVGVGEDFELDALVEEQLKK